MTERLGIDWIRCEARGLCHELLPELLTADDWGYPVSRTGDPAPVVPASLRPAAEEAVLECPRLALRLMSVPTRPGDVRDAHGRRTGNT
jgi:ferredoxin